MQIILFLVSLFASTIGALVGAGGGIIIKPVLDFLGVLPVSTVSFLSSCTVLCMAISSLIRTRHNGVQVQLAVSTPLAVGSALGGLLGKGLFEVVKASVGDEQILGCVQASLLALLTTVVLYYVCRKNTLRSFHVQGFPLLLLAGLLLGLVSSFLGVGGGPYNVAMLFLLFSMEAKTAAKNSIYIIVFSQTVNIAAAFVSNTVPSFETYQLVEMMAGGAGGAILGAEISRHLASAGVEWALKALCVGILFINLLNILQFIR